MKPTIRVYEVQNYKLVLIGIVNTTTSVIWKRAWSTYGDFEIHMGEPDELLKPERFICLNSDPKKFGIIKKAVDDSDGREYNSTQDFTIHGFTANFLLTDRITMPSANDNAKHNGYLTWGKQPAEAIMYDLVKTQVVNPTDAARKNPLIVIADHPAPSGHEVAFQSRFKSVATDLYTLSAATGLGWTLEPDFDTGKLVFKVLHGVDRTQHIETDENGIASASINPNAYIFNQNNKTVKKHTYTHDLSAYKNMAYVAGEGDGAARKIIKLGDDLAGLNRHEVLVDARDIQSSKIGATVTGTLSSDAEGETASGDVEKLTDAQLTERGNAKLQTDYREVHNYEYQAVTEDYRTYWDLGDTCTYIDKKNAVSMDQQITAVEETYEGGSMTVEATFGYTENTISTQVASAQSATLVERKGISKEFDRIDANFVNTNELFAKHAYILGLKVDEATIEILRTKMADFNEMAAQRATFKKLLADQATIGELTADIANIRELTAKKADLIALAAIRANIEALNANKANIDALTAKRTEIESLVANKADIDAITAKKAEIESLTAQTANITALFSDTAHIDTAKIGKLWATLGNVETLLSNRIFAGQAHIDNLTTEQLSVVSGWITSAMIASLTADKITSGEIDTSKVKIKSADGGLSIAGPTLQIADQNNTVRLQLGRDAQGNFTFVLFDETGQGTLIDAAGIHPGAIPDGLIVDQMVASNANIAGSKLNIDSVVDNLNADGTKTINMTKIYLNEDNGTLSEMLARVENDGGFATVNQTTETADGIRQTITELSDATDDLQTQIDANGEALDGVITAQSEFSQTVNGLNASVTKLQTDVDDNAKTLSPITEWMRFDETGMSIGNSNSGRKVKINEQVVEFDNAAGEAVARFAEKAEIHDLEIADGGTFSMGNWAWVPRSNGNLSLKWIGGN